MVRKTIVQNKKVKLDSHAKLAHTRVEFRKDIHEINKTIGFEADEQGGQLKK